MSSSPIQDSAEEAKGAVLSVAVVEKANGPLTKRISLGPDGKLVSDGSQCRMSNGWVRVEAVQSATEFANLIEGLSASEAIMLGRPAQELGAGERLNIVSRKHLSSASTGTIARTMLFVAFHQEPAPMLLDFDAKGIPGPVLARVRTEGYINVIGALMPAAHTAAAVWRPSTSSGITNPTNGAAFNKDNGHLFLFVTDGTDIPRALKVLGARAWLEGLGWIMIGAAGQLLERSIVDVSVGSPERLVFEGPPVVEPPLVQTRESCEVFAGTLLDTRTAILDLTPEEHQQYVRLVTEAKGLLEPEAERVKAAHTAQIVDDMVAGGMDRTKARALIAARYSGMLDPSTELWFDDETTCVTVAEVLIDPMRWHDMTLADPLERDYGRGKARLYCNDDGEGTIIINSMAHGGAVYRLIADYDLIMRLIETTEPDAVLTLVARLVGLADLTPEEQERVRSATTKRAGIGKRVVNDQLKGKFGRHRNKGSSDTGQAMLERLQDAFAILQLGGKHLLIGQSNEVEDINALQMFPEREAAAAIQTQLVGWGIACPSKEAAQLHEAFKASPTTRRCDTIAFSPRNLPSNVLNRWRGPVEAVQAPNTEVDDKVTLLMLYLHEVLCAGDVVKFRYLCRWVQHAITNPEEKPERFIVLLGGEGIGKGTLHRLVRAIWPYTTMLTNNSEHVVGKFNNMLATKYMVVLDEAFFAGDRKSADKMKSLITENNYTLEGKYQSAFDIKSYHRFIALTNHNLFAHISDEDRRHVFLQVSEQRKRDRAYWREIDAAINDPQTIQAFVWVLVHSGQAEALKSIDVRNDPNTMEKRMQKVRGWNGFKRIWHRMLEEETFGPDPKFVHTSTLLHNWKEGRTGVHDIPTESAIGAVLREVCPSAKRYRKQGKDLPGRGFNIPSLAVRKRELEAFVGGPLEWDEYPDEEELQPPDV